MAEKPDIDLSDFVALKPGSKCTVSVAIPKLSDEQREKVLAALEEPTVSTAGIVRKLNEWSGIKISNSTLARHRNKECQCG